MSIKHCNECGQSLPKDRREEPGICERCERAQRAEELEEQLQELREQLEEQEPAQQLEDRIIELLSLGLSPAQTLDVIMTQERGYSVSQWASKRRVTKPAVYNNLSSADPLIEEQTDLTQWELSDAEPEEAQEERVKDMNREPTRDGQQAPSGDIPGFE